MDNIIFFRVDASLVIGTGHLVRCLTLAKKIMKVYSYRVVFVVSNLPESLKVLFNDIDIILYDINLKHKRQEQVCESLIDNWNEDFVECRKISEKYANFQQLWVVDHYGIDAKWESLLRERQRCKLLAIDDLANRHHNCDVLIDSNLWSNSSLRYSGLLPKDCQGYFGAEYFLLREEFLAFQNDYKSINKNVLVFFGGSDPTSECSKVANAIQKLFVEENDLYNTLNIVLITGRANPEKDIIKKQLYHCKNVKVKDYIDKISGVMNDCAYSIGAGGTTVYERMYMGIQSYVVSVAQNQLEAAKNLSINGLVSFLGSAEQVAIDDYYDTLCEIALSDEDNPLICNPSILKTMVNGNGASKIVEIINQQLVGS